MMMKTMIKAMDGVNRLGLKYQTRMPSLSGRMGLKVPKTRFYLAVRCGSTAPENDMERIRERLLKIEDEKGPFHVAGLLTDKHQRHHSYLRISLTERCNLRYCMPEEGVHLTPKENLLTNQEIHRLARLFVRHGVTKIRLTGGEPTLRPDLVPIVEMLNGLRGQGLETIGLTTNAIALKRKLPALHAAGLNALNISLDTLQEPKFQLITRRRGLTRVLETIEDALGLGFDHVKVNVVLQRGINDDEVIDFMERFARPHPIALRFIEYMPFDGNRWSRGKLLPFREVKESIIEPHYGRSMTKLVDDRHDTTKAFTYDGWKGSVGFISSMTDHFCGTCNRLRITADGNLKVCLFGHNELHLLPYLRDHPLSTGGHAEDAHLEALIHAAVQRKHAQHGGMTQIAAQSSMNRPMVRIGG